jgi:Tol biopolymer transport system component
LNAAQPASGPLGQFGAQQDVGTVLHAGSAKYDAARGTYTISGSGDNTWFRSDDLHYVWKKADGDVVLSAKIAFDGTGGEPHRKAMLMIRQSLAADSAYVDVARHGNGLTSLQYRNATGDVTREVRLDVSGPPLVRIAKRGDFFYVWYAGADGVWRYSGASMKLPMHGAFYVGLAVCSHNKDRVETAEFSDVRETERPTQQDSDMHGTLYSTLEVVPVASTDRSVVYTAAAHFEAPNWLKDGSGFLVNQDGHIERIAKGEAPVVIDTGSLDRINNDHVLAPDGTRVAISDNTEPGGSRIYTLPLAGGQPVQLTKNAPSYAHGWSPDGRTIAFCGERDGEFDVYTVSAAGGRETRLTTAKGLDDGPNYSPDGRYIYFNSVRTGHMQIWRMRANGSHQEQVTNDATNNWFAHISPDGKWMVYLVYGPKVDGHPPNKEVTLRVMSLATAKSTLLAKVFGGQGTINVPSWSPDSTEVAFVSYAYVPDVSGSE